MDIELNKKQAIEFLSLDENQFDNYFQKSKEIIGIKNNGKWFFNKNKLEEWNNLKQSRTVKLSLEEYNECIKLAIKRTYSNKAIPSIGNIGIKNEIQTTDDWLFNLLGEYGFKKFLKEKLNVEIKTKDNIHPEYVSQQDIESINNRKPNLKFSIRSSKYKNCFNLISPTEYEDENKKSDVYIFVRVGLSPDHLFRRQGDILFKEIKEFLNSREDFRKIEELKEVEVWICGFTYHNEFEKADNIPGSKFDSPKYIKSVAEMHNKNEEWKDLLNRL